MALRRNKAMGRPRVNPLKPAQNLTICTKCGQGVGKGIRHPCHKRDAAGNFLGLANGADGDGKLAQRMAAKVMKENVGEDNKGYLATGGKPVPVSLGRVFIFRFNLFGS
jgi:hypothetical protein